MNYDFLKFHFIIIFVKKVRPISTDHFQRMQHTCHVRTFEQVFLLKNVTHWRLSLCWFLFVAAKRIVAYQKTHSSNIFVLIYYQSFFSLLAQLTMKLVLSTYLCPLILKRCERLTRI